MRVVSLKLQGFRRFREAMLNLDAPLMAIVGPNQAGKSSILAALEELNDTARIELRDLRRGMSIADDQTVLQVRYRLDPEDNVALANLHGGGSVRFFRQTKSRSGGLHYSTEPRITRPSTLRQRTRSLLSQAMNLRAVRDTEDEEQEEGETSLSTVLRDISAELSAAADDMPPESINAIEAAASAIGEEWSGSSILGRLKDSLEDLARSERVQNPHLTAIGILAGRRPEFLEFTQDDRDLEPDYDLNAVASSTPAALGNLTALAGLDLGQLLAALQRGDAGEVETLEQHANEQLRVVFSEAWRQSLVTVRMRHASDQRLEVLVSAEAGRWASIAESSDGVRAFVALVAFLAANASGKPPVLLVDEAETHLHYDAQADLVRMFERQTAASQVVYTTHSAGCLPLDLGRGIRVIEAHDSGDSTIRNSFWSLGAGLSPLIMGMGASVLAFTATRYAVVGEGGTETVLLPSLLREATGFSHLPYQVAPGLAEASDETLKAMDLEAARVAFVVDGDAEGKKHERRLLRLNVPKARIARLMDGLSAEDLVDARIYLAAVNQELVERHGPDARIPLNRLPASGRGSFVKRWCAQHGLSEMSKTGVAARLVDTDPDVPITTATRRQQLRQIHNRLARAFGLPEVEGPAIRELSQIVRARRGQTLPRDG